MDSNSGFGLLHCPLSAAVGHLKEQDHDDGSGGALGICCSGSFIGKIANRCMANGKCGGEMANCWLAHELFTCSAMAKGERGARGVPALLISHVGGGRRLQPERENIAQQLA